MKADGTCTETALETAKCLLTELIPTDETETQFESRRCGRTNCILDAGEVKSAIWRISQRRSPSLDGITSGILRKAWGIIGDILVIILQKCLRQSVFPECWKTADVVVIKKGADKDPSLPKSYRPVSLLPVPSKVLERLVVYRLENETRDNRSCDQHGFVEGRSTVSAISECMKWIDTRVEKLVMGVFLDISGAFDNLDWLTLMEDMRVLGASTETVSMIMSYLERRRAVLTLEKSTASVALTRGCPQGSQLGPVLWKMSMDSALKVNRSDRVKLVAYADDLVVLCAGKKWEGIVN